MSRNKLKEIREAREAALKEQEAVAFADFIAARYSVVVTATGNRWSNFTRDAILDSGSLYDEFKKYQKSQNSN
jgi:hypothetical protein